MLVDGEIRGADEPLNKDAKKKKSSVELALFLNSEGILS